MLHRCVSFVPLFSHATTTTVRAPLSALLSRQQLMARLTVISYCTSVRDTIGIRIITPSDHNRVLSFLRRHCYTDEPLTGGRAQGAADEHAAMSNIQHGTCHMATMIENGSTSERIVAAQMAGPKGVDEAELLFAEAAKEGATNWGRILQLLARVERDANVYERYGVTRALHAHLIGVDAAVRAKGLGARLLGELMQLGRQLGYPLLTADCSSVYSANMCRRLGFERVNVLRYADYVNERGEPIFQPPPPHVCIQTFAKRLL